jgi:DNA invertase Pin-like site-specific DNA recombinase
MEHRLSASEATFMAPRGKRIGQFRRFEFRPGDDELMDSLSDQQRALLQASGSYLERAAKFGVPIGTVRSRIHRGRAALKALREKRDALPSTDKIPI